MKEIFAEEIAAAQNDPTVKLVVFDAAILLEAGWGDMMDVILYVDADRASREERVKVRGWSAAELARREAAQWPAEQESSGRRRDQQRFLGGSTMGSGRSLSPLDGARADDFNR